METRKDRETKKYITQRKRQRNILHKERDKSDKHTYRDVEKEWIKDTESMHKENGKRNKNKI